MPDWKKYITTEELMQRWEMSSNDLAQATIYGDLTLFVQSRDTICNFNDMIRENLSEHKKLHIFDLLFTEESLYDEMAPSGVRPAKAVGLFLVAEVKEFEKKHRLGKYSDTPPAESSASPQESLPDLGSDEKRELGRLRMEKVKWDTSIKAAIAASSFCRQQSQPITKEQLQGYLIKQKLEIPETTFRMIWRELPEKYRQKAGRPPKK